MHDASPRTSASATPATASTSGTGGDRLWEITDVAGYLGVPRSAVYKMTAPKSYNPIPHFKLGRLLRFRKADIDAWLGLWAVTPVDALSRAQRVARKA